MFYNNAPSATSAETETAIETVIADPDDASQWTNFVANRRIIWNSIYTVAPIDHMLIDANNDVLYRDSDWIRPFVVENSVTDVVTLRYALKIPLRD